MSIQLDNNLLSELMTHADMGWWIADPEHGSYACSKFISELLDLDDTGIITFEDFNKKILKEEQRHTTVHSFDNIQEMPEALYLMDTTKGEIWIRSKICFQKEGEDGKTKIYGIAELRDGPDMASAYQALQRSERILFNIYKNLPVGIEYYDKNGILIDLNNKEIDIFHLNSKEDLLGVNIFENPVFPEEIKEKLRNNEDADFTFRYDFSKVGNYYKSKKKDGTIDLVTKVTTLFDENRNPTNYLLINADRTETTVAYNKIQKLENLFQLVGDYSKVGYAQINLMTGEGHAPKSWYRNIGEKYGIPVSEIIGTYDHIHPEDREVLVQFVQEAKAGKADKLSKEVRILRENGLHTWTYVNLLINSYSPENNKIDMVSINYDITGLKQTEEMLILARDKAEESDRLKSAFLANMSHEIRTPLNAIVGFSNLLSYTEDPNEKEFYNSLISHNNELLLNLINDVIDFSKIESGNIEFDSEWFNMTELINESFIEYENEIPENIDFSIISPEHDYIVLLDGMRIKQILNNFISNALKNTKEGEITISYDIVEGGIRITVSDTGNGIPKDKTEKIFERFEKLDPFAQGAGLGLTICKAIVEKMNGHIMVDSIVGQGSTFWVDIPCQTKQVIKD